MTGRDRRDMISAHNEEVGLLCTQWAYLEWMLEIAVWWFCGLLDAHADGRTMTGGIDIIGLARRARDLAHRKLSDQAERDAMADIVRRIGIVINERNLAVHGVRSLQPDEIVLATVARGKYKNTLQNLSLMRLRSLNEEVAGIIADIEPLLYRHGVIEGVTEISKQGRGHS